MGGCRLIVPAPPKMRLAVGLLAEMRQRPPKNDIIEARECN